MLRYIPKAPLWLPWRLGGKLLFHLWHWWEWTVKPKFKKDKEIKNG